MSCSSRAANRRATSSSNAARCAFIRACMASAWTIGSMLKTNFSQRAEQPADAVQHAADAAARRVVDAVPVEVERLRGREHRLPRARDSSSAAGAGSTLRRLAMRARICSMIRSTSIPSDCAGSSDIHHQGAPHGRRAADGPTTPALPGGHRRRAVGPRRQAGLSLPYRRRAPVVNRRSAAVAQPGSRRRRGGVRALSRTGSASPASVPARVGPHVRRWCRPALRFTIGGPQGRQEARMDFTGKAGIGDRGVAGDRTCDSPAVRRPRRPGGRPLPPEPGRGGADAGGAARGAAPARRGRRRRPGRGRPDGRFGRGGPGPDRRAGQQRRRLRGPPGRRGVLRHLAGLLAADAGDEPAGGGECRLLRGAAHDPAGGRAHRQRLVARRVPGRAGGPRLRSEQGGDERHEPVAGEGAGAARRLRGRGRAGIRPPPRGPLPFSKARTERRFAGRALWDASRLPTRWPTRSSFWRRRGPSSRPGRSSTSTARRICDREPKRRPPPGGQGPGRSFPRLVRPWRNRSSRPSNAAGPCLRQGRFRPGAGRPRGRGGGPVRPPCCAAT